MRGMPKAVSRPLHTLLFVALGVCTASRASARELLLFGARGQPAAEALFKAVRDNLELDEASRRIVARPLASVPALVGAVKEANADFAIAASPRGKKLEIMVVARTGDVV